MKKLINQKVKFYGKTYTIKDYDDTGSICLYAKSEGEIWFNVWDRYTQFGGKSENVALKGESVDLLRDVALFKKVEGLQRLYPEAYRKAF